jgi:hypothetical protein
MPEYVYSIIAVVVVTGIMIWWVSKKKGEEWEGELFKKRHVPGDMDTTDSYKLIFKTTEGKKKRFSASNSKMFDEWEVGDKAKKVKGEFFPTKM